MAVGKKPAAAPLKGKKKPATFVIDCAKPVEDKIMKIGEFEKFLVDKIKVDNKVGELPAPMEQPGMSACCDLDTIMCFVPSLLETVPALS